MINEVKKNRNLLERDFKDEIDVRVANCRRIK